MPNAVIFSQGRMITREATSDEMTALAAAQAAVSVDMLNEKRLMARIPRGRLADVAERIGVITGPEADEWAKGNALPVAFDEELSARLSGAALREARLEALGVSDVGRMDPMIVNVAAGAGVTEAQLDAAFGI